MKSIQIVLRSDLTIKRHPIGVQLRMGPRFATDLSGMAGPKLECERPLL